MPDSKPKKISTSRLAKLAGIDSRQLFSRLLERQWITRTVKDGKNHYSLTSKGEFEGGEYQTSDKFGTYIVWPETLLEHRLLQDMEQPRLTASSIAKGASLSARLVNLLLQELHWIEPLANGWQTTSRGQALGGQNRETQEGASYVSWPESLLAEKQLQQMLAQLDISQTLPYALDGRNVSDAGERLLCNWLYLHRIHFATQRLLTEDIYADLLLPDHALVIQYWGNRPDDQSAAALQRKLSAPEAISAAGYHCLELQPQAMLALDKWLVRELQKAGVRLLK
ncbi:hypothetical protein [Bacterioplanoides sp.]|uniref:hypothetical protein n=1 Tax=Bacterioplanoides sp. TaxID=2066072 RepID=UPI003AFF75F2